MDAKSTRRYDDIIGLPHHVSETRPRMSAMDRAAQFSPFAALTGHGAAIREAERLTDARAELDEDRKSVLDAQLRLLRARLSERPAVTVTYFVPDGRKEGGAYRTVSGAAEAVDPAAGALRMEGGIVIPFDAIYQLDAPFLHI